MVDFMDLIGTEEIAEGQMVGTELEDHELLVAKVGGEFYIADARCPHLHGFLPKGTLEGTIVTCPRHGSQFDLTDGHVVRWTKWTGTVQSMAEAVRHPRPLRVYEARIADGRLQVGPQKEPPA